VNTPLSHVPVLPVGWFELALGLLFPRTPQPTSPFDCTDFHHREAVWKQGDADIDVGVGRSWKDE
jgi:hypothetical protein